MVIKPRFFFLSTYSLALTRYRKLRGQVQTENEPIDDVAGCTGIGPREELFSGTDVDGIL